jgi:small-conductance mechanosensitive channel
MLFNHWIPIDRISPLIGLEAFIITTCLAAMAWLFYHFVLRGLSRDRHSNLRRRFTRLAACLATAAVGSFISWQMRRHSSFDEDWLKAASYMGLLSVTIGAGAIIFLAQLYIYLALFFTSMRAGVPRLLANIFTLIFATILTGWLLSELFGLKILPLLATSAIFSVIIGLAMQDTLGNLFSGLALQLDSPYRLGDWVEVHCGNSKPWVGQIQEITWRATLIQGFSGELVTIPNRTMAQSQVMVFAAHHASARRSQGFRIPFDASLPVAKATLLEVMGRIPAILTDPAPTTLVTDASESWATLKVFYSIADFGAQYRIGDELLSQALIAFRKAGIPLAHPVIELASDRARGPASEPAPRSLA